MPKVSVLMGMYNTKDKSYLEKSLKSILNQTFTDFELIICNDGSTNDCVLWAKEMCDGDSRVKFIENDKNRGLAYTLNHCLKYATGEYIARMDDDDESDLTRFEKQVDYLDSNSSVDLVSTNIKLFDSEGIYNSKEYPNVIKKEDFLFNSPIVHPSIMARKNAFELVNGYRDISMTVRVEDYDLFMRMFSKGIVMHVIQEYLLNYRDDRENSIRRKKYKFRINEAKVRFYGFKKLGLLPKGVLYVIKPLIIGLLPISLIRLIRKG